MPVRSREGRRRPHYQWRAVRELLRALRARSVENLIVALDNFSPHKMRELLAWLAQHDIELVCLPTNASWINLIECRFQALRRVAFNGTDHRSHGEQDPAIHAYLRWRNRSARQERSSRKALAQQGRGPPIARRRCRMRRYPWASAPADLTAAGAASAAAAGGAGASSPEVWANTAEVPPGRSPGPADWAARPLHVETDEPH